MRSTRLQQADRAMVLITDVPTPAICASSAAGIGRAVLQLLEHAAARGGELQRRVVARRIGARDRRSRSCGASSADGTLIAMRSTAPGGASV